MYGLAFRILRNRQEAEDLIQEVFLTVWHNCSYNPERGSFKSFLLVLVRSRAIDRLRSQKAAFNTLKRLGKEIDTENYIISPLDQSVSDDISSKVQAALADLPENQRQALEMAYFKGLSQVEISQHLDVPVGTVKSWFRLGFSKLRKSLKDLIN